MGLFKQTLVKYPNIIKRGKTAVIEWFYDETSKDEIEDARPGCSCTANIEILDDRIRAVYTDNTPESAFQNREVEMINKNINVYFKDGKPLMIKRRGRDVRNPDKKRQTLSFHVSVTK